MRGYDIKYEGVSGNHYKYNVYRYGKLMTYFLNSVTINLKNKSIKRETIEELVNIIKKYEIKGI